MKRDISMLGFDITSDSLIMNRQPSFHRSNTRDLQRQCSLRRSGTKTSTASTSDYKIKWKPKKKKKNNSSGNQQQLQDSDSESKKSQNDDEVKKSSLSRTFSRSLSKSSNFSKSSKSQQSDNEIQTSLNQADMSQSMNSLNSLVTSKSSRTSTSSQGQKTSKTSSTSATGVDLNQAGTAESSFGTTIITTTTTSSVSTKTSNKINLPEKRPSEIELERQVKAEYDRLYGKVQDNDSKKEISKSVTTKPRSKSDSESAAVTQANTSNTFNDAGTAAIEKILSAKAQGNHKKYLKAGENAETLSLWEQMKVFKTFVKIGLGVKKKILPVKGKMEVEKYINTTAKEEQKNLKNSQATKVQQVNQQLQQVAVQARGDKIEKVTARDGGDDVTLGTKSYKDSRSSKLKKDQNIKSKNDAKKSKSTTVEISDSQQVTDSAAAALPPRENSTLIINPLQQPSPLNVARKLDFDHLEEISEAAISNSNDIDQQKNLTANESTNSNTVTEKLKGSKKTKDNHTSKGNGSFSSMPSNNRVMNSINASKKMMILDSCSNSESDDPKPKDLYDNQCLNTNLNNIIRTQSAGSGTSSVTSDFDNDSHLSSDYAVGSSACRDSCSSREANRIFNAKIHRIQNNHSDSSSADSESDVDHNINLERKPNQNQMQKHQQKPKLIVRPISDLLSKSRFARDTPEKVYSNGYDEFLECQDSTTKFNNQQQTTMADNFLKDLQNQYNVFNNNNNQNGLNNHNINNITSEKPKGHAVINKKNNQLIMGVVEQRTKFGPKVEQQQQPLRIQMVAPEPGLEVTSADVSQYMMPMNKHDITNNSKNLNLKSLNVLSNCSSVSQQSLSPNKRKSNNFLNVEEHPSYAQMTASAERKRIEFDTLIELDSVRNDGTNRSQDQNNLNSNVNDGQSGNDANQNQDGNANNQNENANDQQNLDNNNQDPLPQLQVHSIHTPSTVTPVESQVSESFDQLNASVSQKNLGDYHMLNSRGGSSSSSSLNVEVSSLQNEISSNSLNVDSRSEQVNEQPSSSSNSLSADDLINLDNGNFNQLRPFSRQSLGIDSNTTNYLSLPDSQRQGKINRKSRNRMSADREIGSDEDEEGEGEGGQTIETSSSSAGKTSSVESDEETESEDNNIEANTAAAAAPAPGPGPPVPTSSSSSYTRPVTRDIHSSQSQSATTAGSIGLGGLGSNSLMSKEQIDAMKNEIFGDGPEAGDQNLEDDDMNQDVGGIDKIQSQQNRTEIQTESNKASKMGPFKRRDSGIPLTMSQSNTLTNTLNQLNQHNNQSSFNNRLQDRRDSTMSYASSVTDSEMPNLPTIHSGIQYEFATRKSTGFTTLVPMLEEEKDDISDDEDNNSVKSDGKLKSQDSEEEDSEEDSSPVKKRNPQQHCKKESVTVQVPVLPIKTTNVVNESAQPAIVDNVTNTQSQLQSSIPTTPLPLAVEPQVTLAQTNKPQTASSSVASSTVKSTATSVLTQTSLTTHIIQNQKKIQSLRDQDPPLPGSLHLPIDRLRSVSLKESILPEIRLVQSRQEERKKKQEETNKKEFTGFKNESAVELQSVLKKMAKKVGELKKEKVLSESQENWRKGVKEDSLDDTTIIDTVTKTQSKTKANGKGKFLMRQKKVEDLDNIEVEDNLNDSKIDGNQISDHLGDSDENIEEDNSNSFHVPYWPQNHRLSELSDNDSMTNYSDSKFSDSLRPGITSTHDESMELANSVTPGADDIEDFGSEYRSIIQGPQQPQTQMPMGLDTLSNSHNYNSSENNLSDSEINIRLRRPSDKLSKLGSYSKSLTNNSDNNSHNRSLELFNDSVDPSIFSDHSNLSQSQEELSQEMELSNDQLNHNGNLSSEESELSQYSSNNLTDHESDVNHGGPNDSEYYRNGEQYYEYNNYNLNEIDDNQNYYTGPGLQNHLILEDRHDSGVSTRRPSFNNDNNNTLSSYDYFNGNLNNVNNDFYDQDLDSMQMHQFGGSNIDHSDLMMYSTDHVNNDDLNGLDPNSQYNLARYQQQYHNNNSNQFQQNQQNFTLSNRPESPAEDRTSTRFRQYQWASQLPTLAEETSLELAAEKEFDHVDDLNEGTDNDSNYGIITVDDDNHQIQNQNQKVSNSISESKLNSLNNNGTNNMNILESRPSTAASQQISTKKVSDEKNQTSSPGSDIDIEVDGYRFTNLNFVSQHTKPTVTDSGKQLGKSKLDMNSIDEQVDKSLSESTTIDETQQQQQYFNDESPSDEIDNYNTFDRSSSANDSIKTNLDPLDSQCHSAIDDDDNSISCSAVDSPDNAFNPTSNPTQQIVTDDFKSDFVNPELPQQFGRPNLDNLKSNSDIETLNNLKLLQSKSMQQAAAAIDQQQDNSDHNDLTNNTNNISRSMHSTMSKFRPVGPGGNPYTSTLTTHGSTATMAKKLANIPKENLDQLASASSSNMFQEMRNRFWNSGSNNSSSGPGTTQTRSDLVKTADSVLKTRKAHANNPKLPRHSVFAGTPVTQTTNSTPILPTVQSDNDINVTNVMDITKNTLPKGKRSYVGKLPAHFNLVQKINKIKSTESSGSDLEKKINLNTKHADFGIPVWQKQDWDTENQERWFYQRPESVTKPRSYQYNANASEKPAVIVQSEFLKKGAVSTSELNNDDTLESLNTNTDVERLVALEKELDSHGSNNHFNLPSHLVSKGPKLIVPYSLHQQDLAQPQPRPATSSYASDNSTSSKSKTQSQISSSSKSFERNLHHIRLLNGHTSFSELGAKVVDSSTKLTLTSNGMISRSRPVTRA